jgi:hypothetical protein
VTRRDVEGPIHRAVLDYLRYALPGAFIMHPANELNLGGDRKANAIAQARAKSLGMLPGAPDIMALWHGSLWCFEVKAPAGRVSAPQAAVGEHIERMGGRWAVVRSVDDAAACVAAWMGDAPRAVAVELRGAIK